MNHSFLQTKKEEPFIRCQKDTDVSSKQGHFTCGHMKIH